MRIAIVGSGGVGGYFGGRLAAAGADVSFIARGAHLAALRERGLRIESPLGDLHLPKVNATDDTATVGPVDIVVFTVKLYDSEAAIRMLPPLIGPDTLVVSFQNGVDSTEMLARAVGRGHVAGGTTYVACVVAQPGVIKHTAMNQLIFGPLEPVQSARLEPLAEVCQRAGIDTRRSDRVAVEIWTKFARLTVFSGMTAITRCPIGPIVADPDLMAMTEAALHESISVARARQIPLAHSLFDDVVAAMKALPPNTKSSLLQDLEAGRPLELPWLSGAIVRIGREVGVDTPTHRFITMVLKPHVNGLARTTVAAV
jgi:2-dehydropantoate 2-reductase